MQPENPIGRKTLLLDDEPLARLVARKSLEAAGCFVTEASSCAQAEELWTSLEFDLVVLDHRLEDGLGMDLLRRMRDQGRREAAIYLSAEAQEEMTADRQAALGVAVVLSKPLNPDALQQAVRALPAAPIAAEEGSVRVRGRFRVLPLAGALSAARVAELKTFCEGQAWVALDAERTGSIEPEAIPPLAAWAQACRDQGGRLCLMNLPAADADLLARQNRDREIDVLADGRALEALGRRLSSACERLSLLDTIVRRDA